MSDFWHSIPWPEIGKAFGALIVAVLAALLAYINRQGAADRQSHPLRDDIQAIRGDLDCIAKCSADTARLLTDIRQNQVTSMIARHDKPGV